MLLILQARCVFEGDRLVQCLNHSYGVHYQSPLLEDQVAFFLQLHF
jgi:hypothetical protein